MAYFYDMQMIFSSFIIQIKFLGGFLVYWFDSLKRLKIAIWSIYLYELLRAIQTLCIVEIMICYLWIPHKVDSIVPHLIWLMTLQSFSSQQLGSALEEMDKKWMKFRPYFSCQFKMIFIVAPKGIKDRLALV